MFERIKSLFNRDADDVMEKLIEAQPEEARQYIRKLRASWPKPSSS